MSIFHRLKITHTDVGSPILTFVTLDDMPVKCRGYKIEQGVDALPLIELEVVGVPTIEHDEVVCRVSNKREIANLLDKNEFREFVKIWEDLHGGIDDGWDNRNRYMEDDE